MKKLNHKILVNLATLGPVGFLPKAPGTWGSAVAAIAAPFCFLPFTLPIRIIILILLFIIGALACSEAEKAFDKKDPGCVIIDEVLGQWVTYLPFSLMTGWQVLAGFVFFRFFDILKPFPIKQSENWLKKGQGVMIDDFFAGLYACAAVWFFRYL